MKKKIKILIKEINTSGIDVSISPGFSMRRHRVGARSRKKDQLARLEDDLDKTLSTVERLEEYVRNIHRMLTQIINKNKKKK
jgi:hypothetical protein|tara:strand:+ start:910 stop:1155 length:246 start_codon:yes stop_codon:yes gene_type:complete